MHPKPLMAGLVGGLGPEATIDYYRRIVELWKALDPHTLPALVIDSLDVNRGIDLVQNDRAGLVDYLHDSVERLARAGCDFAALTANTPHIVFDELAARSPVSLVSIVETCADEAARRRLKRVGLLGTRFTMAGAFYPSVFGRRNVEVRVPAVDRQSWLHERYIGELLNGVFLAETRAGVTAMIEDLVERHAIEAVVIAGTELPLLIRADEVAGVPLLDSTELHVRAIVERLRAQPAERPETSASSPSGGLQP